MIIAVDFDGTIVTHEFPKIGKILPGALETLRALKANGHTVFLWTMRSVENVDCVDHLTPAVEFMREQGFEFDGINLSPATFSTSPKQHANVYIDDAALGCPKKFYLDTDGCSYAAVDWIATAQWLHDRLLISDGDFAKVKKAFWEATSGTEAQMVRLK